FQTYRILYSGAVKDGTSADTSGAANAYDALYNLAYATVAAADKPLTGANIATSFAKIVPPAPLSKPGATNINAALQLLQAGQGIDYDGASGPLDYDPTTGAGP